MRRRMVRQAETDDILRLRSPGDLAGALPMMLGFVPTESVVLQAVDADTLLLGPLVRADLPASDEPPGPAMTALVAPLANLGVGSLMIVIWTDEGVDDVLAALPRPELVSAVERACETVGIAIRDALTVRRGRWYSYFCEDPLCCPAEGVPVPGVGLGDSLTTALAAEYDPPLSSRQALSDSLRGRPPEGFESGLRELREDLADVDVHGLVFQLLDVYDHALAGPRPEPDSATLMLLIALAQRTLVRDAAVMGVRRDERRNALALWQSALRLCPEDAVPQVATVVACVAWEAGNGALATLACERALELDPDHSLARVTFELIERGIRPDDGPEPEPAERADLLAVKFSTAAGVPPTDDLSNSLQVWLGPTPRPFAPSRPRPRETGS